MGPAPAHQCRCAARLPAPPEEEAEPLPFPCWTGATAGAVAGPGTEGIPCTTPVLPPASRNEEPPEKMRWARRLCARSRNDESPGSRRRRGRAAAPPVPGPTRGLPVPSTAAHRLAAAAGGRRRPRRGPVGACRSIVSGRPSPGRRRRPTPRAKAMRSTRVQREGSRQAQQGAAPVYRPVRCQASCRSQAHAQRCAQPEAR